MRPAAIAGLLLLTAPLRAQEAKDPDAVYCRPPQAQTFSRLPSPKACRTNRQWDALHAQGLDIGPDGKSVVRSEKSRTLNPNECGTSACF
jgi:hypothetical protein